MEEPLRFEDLRDVAAGALAQAAELCRRVQAALSPEGVFEKSDASPVTAADLGSQALVCRRLAERFPDLPVLAEEDAALVEDAGARALAQSLHAFLAGVDPAMDEAATLEAIRRGRSRVAEPRYWVLDPIDGTKGFIRGDHYAIALGLVDRGEVVFGALACPHLPVDGRTGCLLSAGRGAGAWQTALTGPFHWNRMRVSGLKDPAAWRFVESVERAHGSRTDAEAVRHRLGVTAEPVRIDSQCKYAAVARGDAEAYLRLPSRRDYQEKSWDHAAGSIVCEEAGGQVTDVHGRRLDFSAGAQLSRNTGVVVTNGVDHAAVLGAVQAVLGGTPA